MNKISYSFQFGTHPVVLETGQIANQASGAVLVRMGDTVVLVTAVVEKGSEQPRDFFPLTVNYQERYYAGGRFPGGYNKREGRPSVQETLIARLIDRPIRPLFPKWFTNEVQVVATVLSLDPEVQPDIPAMLGAAAALGLSGAPFNGPLAGARVGYCNGQYLLNPSPKQMQESQLDLVVAGTKTAVLMVESKANELSEEVMLGAVMFGHQQAQVAIEAITTLISMAGPRVAQQAQQWQQLQHSAAHLQQAELATQMLAKVRADWSQRLTEALQLTNRAARNSALNAIRSQALLTLESPSLTTNNANNNADDAPSSSEMISLEKRQNLLLESLHTVERELVRSRAIARQPRLDGRDLETVRPITIELDLLPRVHGSALFTRGETQALVVATLGTNSDAQSVDAVAGMSSQRFLLHYNFPPYCTGEVGMMGSPKRRELGHGNLARRALEAVMPSAEQFPYVVRLVSEITSSNGSSSMASVCGGCLALMAAGVPITAPVAGVAMGLVKEGEDFVVLTDILGDEDHLGDMDFKVAGSAQGITALQMDIKIDGITEEIMRVALQQAYRGRMHILQLMQQAIPLPRAQLSAYAPRLLTFSINPEKIKDVIGKGGSVIRGIVESSGATVDLQEDGTVTIASASAEAANDARRQVELIVADPVVNMVYHGIVSRIMDFGALVTILPGKDGLLHISQISHQRVKNVRDHLTEGQQIDVKVLEVDSHGKIRLSHKALLPEQPEEAGISDGDN